MRQVALLLTVLLLPAAASGQDWRGPAALEVQVEDAKGRNLAGAEILLVYLSPEGGGSLPSVLTDANGKANIGGLAAGRWTAEIRHSGQMSFRAELMLAADAKPVVQSASHLMAPGATSTMKVKFARGRAGAPAPATPAPKPPADIAPVKAPPPVAIAPAPVPPAPVAKPPVKEMPPAVAVAPAPAPVAAPAPEKAPVKEMPAVAPVAPAPTPVPAAPAAKAPVKEVPPAVPVAPALGPVAAPATERAPVKETSPAAPLAPAPSPVPAAPAVKAPAKELLPAAPVVPSPAPVGAPMAEKAPVKEMPPVDPVAPVAPVAPPVAVAPSAVAAAPPAPVPAPAAPPAVAPAPVAPAPAPAAPSRPRLCVECPPGESAAWGEAAIAGGATAGCPGDLQSRLKSVDLAAVGALSAELEAAGLGCRVIAVELPAGARFTGFRFEAQSAAVSADCLPGRDCPAGGCRFPNEPVLRVEGKRTTLLVAFESTAPELRRAVVAGYSTYNKR